MADKTIKTRIQLDGENEYRQALADANRKLKILRSELKAETAELGNNATAQQKAAAKSKSLAQQISQQEKIVKTLEAELKQAKTQYKDNEEVQDRYAEKLNKAREQLANMKNALEDCNRALNNQTNGFGKVASSAGSTATAVFSINDGIKDLMNAAGNIGSMITDAFSATLNTIREVAGEISALMVQAWASADDWQSIADVYGGSAADVQKLFRMASYAGFDTSGLTTSIEKLVSRTHNGTKELSEGLAELEMRTGMSLDESNFDSHLDYYMAVIQALANVTDKGDRLSLAENIFGDKQGAKFSQFLEKWNMAMANWTNLENTSAVFSQEDIDAMNGAMDSLRQFQTDVAAFKDYIGKTFTTTLNAKVVLDDADNILTDIMSFFGSDTKEKKAEALLKLSEDTEKLVNDIITGIGNLSEFFSTLGEELSSSDSPVLKALGSLSTALGDVLDWLVEQLQWLMTWLNEPSALNPDKTNLQNILDWAELEIKSLVTTGSTIEGNLGKIWDTVKSILSVIIAWKVTSRASSLFSGFSNAANAATGGAAGGGTSAASSGFFSWLGGKVASGSSWMSSQMANLATNIGAGSILAGVGGGLALGNMVAEVIDPILEESWNNYLEESDDNVVAATTDFIQAWQKEISKQRIYDAITDPESGLYWKGTGFATNDEALAVVEQIAALIKEREPDRNVYDWGWSPEVAEEIAAPLEEPADALDETAAALDETVSELADAIVEVFGPPGDTRLQEADEMYYGAMNGVKPSEIAAIFGGLAQRGLFDTLVGGLTIDDIYKSIIRPGQYQAFDGGEGNAAREFAEAVADFLETNYGYDVGGYEAFENYSDVLGMRLNNIPSDIATAIKTAMGGIKVVMDGQVVGNIVTNTVSQNIASGMMIWS